MSGSTTPITSSSLEDLWRLGQRVHGPRRHTARHEEVACALGGRAREHGGLDLEEAAILEVAADRGDHAVAQLDGGRHALSAQVEVAVLQSQLLVDRTVLVDLERRGLRAGE
jgi:hypothetical protein